MKKFIYKYLLIVLCGLLPIVQSAYAQREELRKEFAKAYKVSASDLLHLSNRYGKVHINTNNGNEVKVEIEMLVRARSKTRAQEILDKISIEHEKSGGRISFETRLNSITLSGGDKIEINYKVAMPARNPLEVSNKFGDIYLGDFFGKLQLECQYGSVKIDRLTGEAKNLNIKYGDLNGMSLENGNVYVAYGNMNIDKVGEARLEGPYSNLKVNEGDKINLIIKYGNFRVNKANYIKGESAYSNIDVRALNDFLKMDIKYNGKFEIEQIAKGFESIEVNSSYSSCNLGFVENTGFNFKVNLRYGNLRFDGDAAELSYREIDGSKAIYEGKYNRGGKGTVVVNGKYGNVRIN
jgi:hypothetical protein